MITEGIFLVFVIGSLFNLLFYRAMKLLPLELNLCLFGFSLGTLSFFIESVYAVVTPGFHDISNESFGWTLANVLGMVLYMLPHWLFTSHYLGTAIQFNILFEEDS